VPPAAVVFDLGNVLIRWDPHPAVAAGVGDAEARAFLDAEDFDFSAWNKRADAGAAWLDLKQELATSHPHWHEHASSYVDNFGLSLVEEIDDNVAVLRDLHAAGVPLFALSNWSHELFPVALERFDFLSLFEDILISGTERVAKPDPAVFELLGRRVGRPLSECVFVDDSAANVTAAAKAGMDAIHFTDEPLRAQLRQRGFPV
jgi:2-haloacid dehalogenase